MKTLEMNEKSRKNKGVTDKITPISVTNCPNVPNLISNECHEADRLLNGYIIWRLSNQNIHEF